jgi:hypothetical protein
MEDFSKATKASLTSMLVSLRHPDHEIPDLVARHRVIPTKRWLDHDMPYSPESIGLM